MEQYKDFSACVQAFFTSYLVNERGVSHNTIRSYRDTFNLLLEYMSDIRRTPVHKVSFSLLDKGCIVGFLDWLEGTKGCSVSTRNQRFTALRSFFRYVLHTDPSHMKQWMDICSMKKKKGPHGSLEYLPVDGIALVLKQVDTSTAHGFRDLVMMSTMYNTACRCQELIDLTPRCLNMDNRTVTLYGKGSKYRTVWLDEDISNLLKEYLKRTSLDAPGRDGQPLFPNSWGGKMTGAGVTYVVKKYAGMARELRPDLVNGRISPHVFRHSRAMHLLQAGVELIYIRDILGHVSIQTTEIYARADNKAKTEALENAYKDIGIQEPEVKPWAKNAQLKEFLKSLA